MVQGVIRLTHTKNGGAREIPINETVRSVLAGLRTRIGLTDFHFHDLRHTFASWLVMPGVPLGTVSQLLGHKSITMTMRYAHLSPHHKAHAVCSLDKNLTIEAKTAS
jgi:integrase